MTDEEKDEYLAKQAETDAAPEDRFRGLTEDLPLPGAGESWLSKAVGDSQQYNQVGKDGTVSYSVNVIKSLRWPGALTVAQNGPFAFANIYVGYGLKRGDISFNPTEPPEVQKDPVDQYEQPEVSLLFSSTQLSIAYSACSTRVGARARHRCSQKARRRGGRRCLKKYLTFNHYS